MNKLTLFLSFMVVSVGVMYSSWLAANKMLTQFKNSRRGSISNWNGSPAHSGHARRLCCGGRDRGSGPLGVPGAPAGATTARSTVKVTFPIWRSRHAEPDKDEANDVVDDKRRQEGAEVIGMGDLSSACRRRAPWSGMGSSFCRCWSDPAGLGYPMARHRPAWKRSLLALSAIGKVTLCGRRNVSARRGIWSMAEGDVEAASVM